jgi:hypothetical protein
MNMKDKYSKHNCWQKMNTYLFVFINSNFTLGIYFVQVSDRENTSAQKLIIQ